MAENWKPTSGENLSLEWRDTTADYPVFWRRVTEPLDPADLPSVDSPAKLLGASSSLPERADVFLPQGIWRNAPFDAARLFDGLPETAWAVRTPRGGVGEYVRFSLDSDVERIEISNGWQRSSVNFPDKDTWSYFGKNNRVKTLDIVRDDGSLVERLRLADTREVQRFNASLPAGIYRAGNRRRVRHGETRPLLHPVPGVSAGGVPMGSCWVMQCRVPRPQTRSTEWMPTTVRPGKRSEMMPSA